MAKSFTFRHELSPKERNKLIKKGKPLAKKNGVTLIGDHNSGDVSGYGFKGSYKFSKGQLKIIITDKPPIPWFLIEGRINNYGKQYSEMSYKEIDEVLSKL